MVFGDGYVGCVVFYLWRWVLHLWYVSGKSHVVDVCGVNCGSVCVVIDGVVYVVREAEEPMI